MRNSILTIAGVLLVMQVSAQKISDYKVFEKDNNVTVSFTTVLDKLPSNQKLTLTPVLYNGTRSKALEPIVLVGRNKAISEKRDGDTNFLRSKNGLSVPYTVSVPYQSWMGDVSLRIDRKTESCCDEEVLSPLAVVKEKPIRYDMKIAPVAPIVADLTPIQKLDIKAPYLYPMSEYKAVTDDFDVLQAEGALIVRFRQGGTAIDPAFADNRKSLEEVRKVLELIEADPRASLGKIVLAGASSPEGSFSLNEKMSQGRADALKKYLGENVSSKAGLFEVINLGEDWVGLRKMVEASTMQYKQEVLDIIDTYGVYQGREVELMRLKGGRPYNYMFEHFFPLLRSAGYIRIFYESKPSLDFVATNQAIERYNRKEYSETLNRLEGVNPTATTEGIRGMCYLMIGDYTKAETVLKRAVALGNPQAVDYLAQLSKLKAVNAAK